MHVFTADLERRVSMTDPCPRHYQVRSEWVWSKANQDLSKRIVLKVDLSTLDQIALLPLLQQWLKSLGSFETESATVNTANIKEYAIGGCGITVRPISDNAIQLLLFSGGQDALESLDDLVQDLYTKLIQPNKNIAVDWTELPIE